MNKAKQQQYVKAFGQHMQKLRLAKGFSQQDIAFATDLEISQISRIERGIINTSIWQVSLIANAMNVKVSELFDFEMENG